jgi:hypothetical protein
MSDPQLPDDFTSNWPDEPDKADVEAFAQGLAAGLPQLPVESLERVRARMHEELRRQRRQRWRMRIAVSGTLAASVIVGMLAFRSANRYATPTPPAPQSPPPVEIVRDTFSVPLLVSPAAPTPDKPLIDVASYQGLFAD